MSGEIKHGTRSGYNKHRSIGEAACAECKAANAAYMRASGQGRRYEAVRNAAAKWVRSEHSDVWADALTSNTIVGRSTNLAHSHAVSAVARWVRDVHPDVWNLIRSTIHDTVDVVRAEPRPINHGTVSGCNAHRRRGETPCDDCLAAERDYSQRRRGRIDALHMVLAAQAMSKRFGNHETLGAKSAELMIRNIVSALNGLDLNDLSRANSNTLVVINQLATKAVIRQARDKRLFAVEQSA